MRSSGFLPEKNNLLTIIEVPFDSRDSINGLSLKYGCSASALKRLNKLQKDQDLYGLPHIKVPVIKHGTVHELIQNQLLKSSEINKVSLPSTPYNETPPSHSLTDTHPLQPSMVKKYLEEVDEKLALLKEKEAVITGDFILPADELIKTVERKHSKWNTVLIIIGIICVIVVVPITLILLIVFQHS